MKILSIETSCDETAISILEVKEEREFHILGNALFSQANLHQEYGGVYPTLAKREHAKNLVPLLSSVLSEAKMEKEGAQELQKEKLKDILTREPQLFDQFCLYISKVQKPPIDKIAVTHGPGLEPALWVGINFAKALSLVWGTPITPVNHMEGHIFSSLLEEKKGMLSLKTPAFPLIALLISGGHTELVLIKDWENYKLIGSTRDDAVGEAFDKVARLLDLPYPGGPEISRLAEEAREKDLCSEERLPRPMLKSDDLDFSFSGLKTAVLYRVKNKKLSREEKQKIAREFEDATTDVLLTKAKCALSEYRSKGLLLGGGVAANTHIRRTLKEKLDVTLYLPQKKLTTDNAIMIGVAGYFNRPKEKQDIVAQGNLSFSD